MAITITVFPDSLVASRNDTWITVNTTDTNVMIRMEVYSLPADQKIVTVFAPVDGSNNAIFNLKLILQSMGILPDVLSYELPVFNQNTSSLATKNIKGYYVKFFTVDRVTGNDISNVIYNANTNVLLAGKSFLNGNISLLTIIGDGTSQRRFLTCQPQVRKITKQDQQYLFYYHNQNGISSGPVNIALKVVITFTDKTTSTQTVFLTSINDRQIFIFPCGYNQLNLDSDAGSKIIASYTVCLVLQSDTTTAITNTFQYDIDKRCFVKRKQFLFVNSLGGMDTIFTTDESEIAANVTTEPAERMLTRNYDTHEGQYFNFYSQSFNTYKASTDLLTLDERKYLVEFFASKNIWQIGDSDFIPVLLTDNNFALQKDRPELQSINFSYRYAFDDIAYNNF